MHCQHLGSTCLGPANKLQFFQYPNFANLITLWFFKVPAKNLSCVFDGFCMFLGVLKDDGFEMNCPKWWFNLAMDQWNICRFTHEKNSKWFYPDYPDYPVYRLRRLKRLFVTSWQQLRTAEVCWSASATSRSRAEWQVASLFQGHGWFKTGDAHPTSPQKIGKIILRKPLDLFFSPKFSDVL